LAVRPSEPDAERGMAPDALAQSLQIVSRMMVSQQKCSTGSASVVSSRSVVRQFELARGIPARFI
jgi:hypothetical protein